MQYYKKLYLGENVASRKEKILEKLKKSDIIICPGFQGIKEKRNGFKCVSDHITEVSKEAVGIF